MTLSKTPILSPCWALVLLLLISNTSAADRKTFAMSEFFYKAMQTVQEQVEAEQYEAAFAELEKLREKKLSEYERAHTWNQAAFAYYKQGKYRDAIKAYRKMLEVKQEQIPEGLWLDTVKRLGQLSLTVEEYQDAIRYSEELLGLLPVPDPGVYIIIGQAYYSLDKYNEARQPIQTAIKLTRESGNRVNENWLLLLNAVYYNLLDYKGMQSVLRELISEYPKAKYMLNLAAVYSEQGDTEAQTALMEALYETGLLLNENQLVNLANLYMLHKVPYKAALLLEKQIQEKRIEATEKNFEYLAQAWQLAGDLDRALEPLGAAAKLAGDGNTYVRLAQLHFSRSQWRNAELSLASALEKGDLDDRANVHLMLGMARFNQKRFDDARSAFRTAGKDEKMSKLARQWLSYTSSEEEKYKILKD